VKINTSEDLDVCFEELNDSSSKKMWLELRNNIADLIYREIYDKDTLDHLIKGMDELLMIAIHDQRKEAKECVHCRDEKLDFRGYGTLCTQCYKDCQLPHG